MEGGGGHGGTKRRNLLISGRLVLSPTQSVAIGGEPGQQIERPAVSLN